MTDNMSQHAIIFETITNFDKHAAKGLRMWKQKKLELTTMHNTIEPMHEILLPFISELHIIWIKTPQVYDVCNLHYIPHYSLTYEETKNLIEKIQNNHIKIVQYYTNQNYIGNQYRIQVTNVFEDKDLFSEEEIDYVFDQMSVVTNNKYCNNKRGNKSVSGGYSTQIRKNLLTSTDANYKGILNCNKPHFMTTFGKMYLNDFYKVCAEKLSIYSRQVDNGRLGDKFRTQHCQGVNIYEGITIAILDMIKEKVYPHVDSCNDHRDQYNSCTVYSVIRNNKRLSFIGYAKKSVGDFINRLKCYPK